MMNSKGLSLIEVIVALSIITLVLTPLLGLQSSLVRTIRSSAMSLEYTFFLKNIWYQAHQEQKYKNNDVWRSFQNDMTAEYSVQTCDTNLPALSICEKVVAPSAQDNFYSVYGIWYYPRVKASS